MLILLILVIAKTFSVSHPLRYVFLALLLIGFVPGYLRYQMQVRKQRYAGHSGTRRYGLLLVLLGVYLGFRQIVRNWTQQEISGEDYGIAMGFFVLGIFLAYYGLCALYLWRNRQDAPTPEGRMPRS